MAGLRKLAVLAGIALVLLVLGAWAGARAGLAAVTSVVPAAGASPSANGLSAELAALSTWFSGDPSGSAADTQCTWPPPFSFTGFSVAPAYRWPVRLGAGATLEAEFVVGEGRNIRFWVEDPRGKRIYDPGLVAASHSFAVTVPEAGTYRMIFEKDCFFCTRAVLSRHRIY